MKHHRFLALILVSILLFTGCLSACGKKNPLTEHLDPKNPVTLTLWHYYTSENQQELESAIATFNQTTGIEYGVIIDPIAKGAIADLEAAVTDSAMGVINAAPMPDIFSSYADKVLDLDALGVLCDLNAYFTEEDIGRYVQGFIKDGFFSDGRLLLLPIVKSTELLYVNATAWNAFAASEGYTAADLATWEQIYETARAYYQLTDAQTPDIPWDGTALIGIDSLANYIIVAMKQMGVNIIDGDNACANLEETALRKVFDIYFRGMTLGYFNAIGKFRSDDIKSGDLIAYVGSSSSAAFFPTWIEENNTQRDIDFTALPYPYFAGGTPYAIQQGAGMCISKSTAQRQAGAALFLKWFTAPEQNLSFAMTTGYLPVQTAAYESDTFSHALNALKEGSKAQQNVAAVYDIALHQILAADTYAAKPFDGSYTVRSLLSSSLLDTVQAGYSAASSLKAQGASEEEILAALDQDAYFSSWITALKSDLDANNIAHK